MPPLEDMPSSVLTLNEKQRKFAWGYLFSGGHGAEAARFAGYSDASEACKVRAHGLLQRDDINAALRDLSTKYLFSLAPKAIIRLGELLDDRKHHKHFDAIRLTMGVTYFPEKQQVEHHHTGSVQVNHTDAALEALAYLKSMDVPREKLIQQFGHSGLERYERMLEERNAKRGMKVIEHDGN